MTENNVVYITPLIQANVSRREMNEALENPVSHGQRSTIRFCNFRKAKDKDYVGKYCLVDWLDDNAIIDCSLIHEWD